MSRFSYHPTVDFAKKLEEVERHDPLGHKRVVRTIERLLDNPADSDGKMQGPHRGRLKKYVGRSGYRLIYNWCNTCRKANIHLENACPVCTDQIEDDSVVFLGLFHKNEAVRLGYG